MRILLEKQLPIDLEAAVAQAVSLQPVAVPEPVKLEVQLLDFIWGRASSLFEEPDLEATKSAPSVSAR